MPQLSETMISLMPLQLSISGNGIRQNLPARIVGFSSRLNTIAVPPQFMQWANDRFADTPPQAPSRLIIRTTTPGNPDINRYLADHNYIPAGDKIDNSRASYLLNLLTTAIIAIGATITLLSLLILLLSFHLLIQKNRTTLRRLMLLGYTPSHIATPYILLTITISAITLLLSITALLLIAPLWQQPLHAIDIATSSPLLPITAAILITLLITTVNILAITRATRRAFPAPRQK